MAAATKTKKQTTVQIQKKMDLSSYREVAQRLWKLSKLIGKFLRNVLIFCVVFIILEHYVPEIKEQLPEIYRFVHFLEAILNGFFKFFMDLAAQAYKF